MCGSRTDLWVSCSSGTQSTMVSLRPVLEEESPGAEVDPRRGPIGYVYVGTRDAKQRSPPRIHSLCEVLAISEAERSDAYSRQSLSTLATCVDGMLLGNPALRLHGSCQEIHMFAEPASPSS